MRKAHRTNSAIRRFIMTIIFLVLTVTFVSACGQQTTGGNGKLKITATTGMITDVVQQVGGEYVEATGLMGAGIDPHLYKASQGDVKKLDDADVIFYNGLHLEGKMAEMFEALEQRKPTVAVSSYLKEDQLHAAQDQSLGGHDPHIWFNVKLWMSATEVIRDTLVEKDPEHADYYKENAAAYIKELEQLDNYAREQIALIPEKARILVTAHDAFGYFGEAYGLTVTGLQGMNTMSEYGSKDVSKLRDYLVENKIKAVFIESSVPKKSIESVIEGARQLGHEVKIGGELYSDAMGDAGTEEGTYIGMVKHNVDTIVAALK
ncbi:metal ABC transporter solute-binding protein, Zn/Mn family [Paenibacillus prosopidis]|uniref:Manganese/zinc/iron transport system substrate-binding protein n=1 Tax=Paenibacillus prosopidis TaxID=630520 RepID=A0A368VKG7_9BACL|nr:zinc ABC transporter substrate-binding protein [Paenibacillus prosopidis]RCW41975.1 manganese/zinc/iron transport system substrate-binding protein [Paenibacillus prosopidis]